MGGGSVEPTVGESGSVCLSPGVPAKQSSVQDDGPRLLVTQSGNTMGFTETGPACLSPRASTIHEERLLWQQELWLLRDVQPEVSMNGSGLVNTSLGCRVLRFPL